MRGSRAAAAVVVAALSLHGALARAAEAGEVTFPFMLGTNLYTHRFAAYGKAAADRTIADTFGFSQFVGAGYFVTDRLRLGLNLQFTEAVTQPTPAYPSAFTIFALLPQLNFNFWGPLTASLVPTIPLRLEGEWKAGFAVQAVLAAALPLGAGFSGVVALEVPVFFYPTVSVGLTPLIGVTWRLPRPLRREGASAERHPAG